ncbi:MAG: type VI secretion system ATPase TssH [Oscillospiraceae bacterium]|nr:type VI secretion system ATPase TssH [Oscillospiraceae bacterium]
MSKISRVALFGKLNPLLHKAIESATVFAKLRGNPYVELTHWIYQLIQLNDSDLHRIFRHYNVDGGKLASNLLRELERLPAGALAIEDLSGDIDLAVERAWVCASLTFGAPAVRSAYLLIALLTDKTLRGVTLGLSQEFTRINVDDVQSKLASLISGSPEEGSVSTTQTFGDNAEPGETSGAMAPAAMGKQEALRKFTVDITERASKGELDVITGRDDEIRQMIDILMRRRQNNPLLAGEAGVGKTAVVEGFAQRLVSGDVPPNLQGVQLRSLDVGLLQAGASMKGEFEQRLRQLIEEVQHSPKPIILFIDEVHTLIGAGGAAGTGDAANLLKPALARGTLRTIGATTWGEYKKYIEKDPALTRRFQVIQVQEPDEAKAVTMLRGIIGALQKHHGVRVLDNAIHAAVSLSHRYIPARQLPDKAISLVDTAAARVAVSQHATPGELEDCQRLKEVLQTELNLLLQEQAVGITNESGRSDEVHAQLEELSKKEEELQQRWEKEKTLIGRIIELQEQLEAFLEEDSSDAPIQQQDPDMQEVVTEAVANVSEEGSVAESEDQNVISDTSKITREELLAEREKLELELASIRGECPLVLGSVDEQAVASVVADWTGIPVGRMLRNEAQAVLDLVDNLEQRVIGQRHGLVTIARRIQTSRAKLDNPSKPIGVFMLCGPSGIGKTETALALAEFLYGGEQNMITINMSEFQEAHTVSTLKGAPPGYVGYGEGGVLTEAVRRRPYSVVLLDEIEKAHSDVHELFFQVFDKGHMEDGEGRKINFRNTIIILTSNVGTDVINNLCEDPDLAADHETVAVALRKPLLEVFPPALLGRLIVVPYYPLSRETLSNIVRLHLKRIQKRLADSHDAVLDYDDSAIDLVIKRCNTADAGGRMIDAILTNSVLPAISRKYLEGLVIGQGLRRVVLKTENDEFAYEFEMVELGAEK